ncbi:T9SS type A sorting domain-containing protein [Candidatus Kapabacteria bacterium]|nr:T9SS type A sorting domain-containing protein [Candidatus Kapabacteria bacterium]
MKHLLLLLTILNINIFSQMERTTGPYGGVVSDMATHRGVLYCSMNGNASMGGIYYLKGGNWINNSEGLPNGSSVVSMLSDDNNLYLATAINGIFILENNIWKSYSGNFHDVKGMIKFEEDLVVFTKNSGIYKSNNGINWTNIIFNLESKFIYSWAKLDNTLFVGLISDKVYKLDLTNNKWDNKSEGIPNSTNSAIISMTSIGDNLIVSDTRKQYISKDKGETWNPFTTNDDNNFYVESYYKIDNNLFGINYNNVYLLQDNEWELKFTASSFSITNFIKFNDKYYFSRNHWGISQLSTNFNNPTEFQAGICNSSLTCLTKNDKYLYAAELVNDFGFVNRSDDEGKSWERMSENLSQIGYISLSAHGDTVLAGSDGAGLYLTTNSGDDWYKAKGTPTGYLGAVIYHKENIIIGPNGFSQGVSISKDFGDTFTKIDDLPNDGLLFLIEYDGNVYAGTRSKGIFFSEDGGNTWSEQNQGISMPQDFIFIKDMYTDGNSIICATYDSIYLLDKINNKWNKVNFTSDSSNWITSLMINNDIILCTTKDMNIHYSIDKGESFQLLSEGDVNPLSINDITVSNGNIYLASFGSGVWKIPLSEFENTSINNDSILNVKIHPNPVSEVLYIDGLEHLGNKTIKLINYEGKVVLQKMFGTGAKIQLPINNLNTGHYFLSIISEGKSIYKKLIII